MGHRFSLNQAALIKDTSALFDQGGAPDYQRYIDAVKQGLLTEAEIDVALERMLRLRFELGLFDPLERVKAAQVPDSELDSPAHRELALKLARESMVLLKTDGMLPFPKAPARIAVVGPLADNRRVLLGNYNGWPSRSTTALEGVRKQFPKARVVFEPGTTYLRPDVPVPTSALSTRAGAPGPEAEVFEKPDFSLHQPGLFRYYTQLKLTKPDLVARVATAHRATGILWATLRDQHSTSLIYQRGEPI